VAQFIGQQAEPFTLHGLRPQLERATASENASRIPKGAGRRGKHFKRFPRKNFPTKIPGEIFHEKRFLTQFLVSNDWDEL
jgi:ribonuclease I